MTDLRSTSRRSTSRWLALPLWLVGLVWVALAGLVACGGGDDQAGAADSASASIGAAGGTVTTASGAQVVIPAGALAAPTTIAIERTVAGAPILPPGFVAGGALFALTPHGTAFAAPVTVRIPVDPGTVPAGLTPTLYKTNTAGNWERVAGATLSGSIVTAQVTGFSFFNFGASPPQITQQPQDATVNAGSSAAFNVTALGSPPFGYQWQRSADAGVTFADIAGATDRSHTVAATTNADNGTRYRAIVSNPDGPATSQPATLTVTAQIIAPAITTQPAGLSVAVGADATFTITSNGSAPLHQWQISRDAGVTFIDVVGATNASFTHAAAAIADNGAIYRVVVSNSAGSATSLNALLTVTTAPAPGPGASGAVLGAGSDFSVALLADGTLRSWGSDQNGALGDGGATNTDRASPGPVAGLNDVITIDSSGTSTLALRRNGEVWGWGDNLFGQIGVGTPDTARSPLRFMGSPALGAVRAVSAGNSHGLVLRADGRIEAVGFNAEGQLGNPTVVDRASTGVEVVVSPGMKAIIAISAGNYFSVALDEDGVVWTWGTNSVGQLGHGTQTGSPVPKRVDGIGPVKLIAAGHDHVLAVDRSGAIWSWGGNENGKLGRGDIGEFAATPGRVMLTGEIVAIAAGVQHSLSLHFDGSVFVWGINETGQLGTGSHSPGFSATPVFVASLPSGIVAIAAGGGVLGHSLALGPDGRVWAWGHNNRGQLGDGTTAFRLAPVVIPGLNLR